MTLTGECCEGTFPRSVSILLNGVDTDGNAKKVDDAQASLDKTHRWVGVIFAEGLEGSLIDAEVGLCDKHPTERASVLEESFTIGQTYKNPNAFAWTNTHDKEKSIGSTPEKERHANSSAVQMMDTNNDSWTVGIRIAGIAALAVVVFLCKSEGFRASM